MEPDCETHTRQQCLAVRIETPAKLADGNDGCQDTLYSSRSNQIPVNSASEGICTPDRKPVSPRRARPALSLGRVFTTPCERQFRDPMRPCEKYEDQARNKLVQKRNHLSRATTRSESLTEGDTNGTSQGVDFIAAITWRHTAVRQCDPAIAVEEIRDIHGNFEVAQHAFFR